MRRNPKGLLQFRALGADRQDLTGGQGTAKKHLRFGWWSIFVFATLGLLLETLHGFKVNAYVGGASETRRLMWTLAHAHGTLLGLAHIAFSVSLRALPAIGADTERLASRSLVGASLLLPGGFFLGGVRFYAGDPGVGAALVPIGAVLLLVAAWQVARAAGRSVSPRKP